MTDLIFKKQHPGTYSFPLDLYQLHGDGAPKDWSTARGLRRLPRGKQLFPQCKAETCQKERQGRTDEGEPQKVHMHSKPHTQTYNIVS